MAEVHKYIELDEYEIIIFECNGLLVDWRTSIIQTIKEILNENQNIPQPKGAPDKYFNQLLEAIYPWRSFQESSKYFIYGLTKEPKDILEEGELNVLVQSIEDWQLFSDVEPSLKALKNKGRKTAISIPGFDEKLFEPLKKKFDDLNIQFDYTITYDEEKTEGIYSKADFLRQFFKQQEIPEDTVLYVGGNHYHDIRASNSAKVDTALISRPGYVTDHPEYYKDYKVDQLYKPHLHLPDLKELSKWPLPWYRFLSKMPGTKPFNYKVKRTAKSLEEYERKRYKTLTSIDDERKERLEKIALQELEPSIDVRSWDYNLNIISEGYLALIFVVGLISFVLTIIVPYFVFPIDKQPLLSTTWWQLGLMLPIYIGVAIFILGMSGLFIMLLTITGIRFWGLIFLFGFYLFVIYRFIISSSIFYLDTKSLTIILWATILFNFILIIWFGFIERNSKEKDWLRLLTLDIFILYTIWIAFFTNRDILLSHLSMAIFASVAGSVTIGILLLIFGILIVTFRRIKTYKLTRNYPSGVIVQNLLDILKQVEEEKTDWGSSGTTKSLLLNLEEIITALQSLANYIQTGDLDSDFWYRQEMNLKVQEVRRKKKWVLTPQPQTRIDFQGYVSKSFVQVLERNWDALFVPEPDKSNSDSETEESNSDSKTEETRKATQLERRQAIGNRLARAIRRIIAGLFPLGIVWFLLNYFPPMPDLFITYITIFAVIWAVLAILRIIDDSIVSDNLDIAKAIAELFWGKRDEPEKPADM